MWVSRSVPIRRSVRPALAKLGCSGHSRGTAAFGTTLDSGVVVPRGMPAAPVPQFDSWRRRTLNSRPAGTAM